jgi:hypothetical protein
VAKEPKISGGSALEASRTRTYKVRATEISTGREVPDDANLARAADSDEASRR